MAPCPVYVIILILISPPKEIVGLEVSSSAGPRHARHITGTKRTTAHAMSVQPIASSLVSPSPESATNSTTSPISIQQQQQRRPRIPILQYHSDWVCVNKPAQMTVHRSTPKRQNNHREQYFVAPLVKRQLSRKVWPVHRLDHRTSGALLLAFDAATCAQLHQSLRQANKEYLALVRGDWTELEQASVLMVDKSLMVDGVEKRAVTEFQFLASIRSSTQQPSINNDIIADSSMEHDINRSFEACTLVLCRPKTGRKHQIRRHAFAMGYPILGDTEHGHSQCNRWWRQHRQLHRLFLHCLSLDLPPLQPTLRQQQQQQQAQDLFALEEDGDGYDDLIMLENEGSNKRVFQNEDATNAFADRIHVVAPLAPELARVLQRPEMKDLWQAAVRREPRLSLEPIDERGGSMGRGVKRRREHDEYVSE